MSSKSARSSLRWIRLIAKSPKNVLLDLCGSVATRGWKAVTESGTGSIRPDALSGVRNLHSDIFNSSSWNHIYYSRLFPHTFYIVEEDSTVIGFCSCRVHPMLSRTGLVLKARILSFGIHPNHRGRGVARLLLERCMVEMALNGIVSIDLFVDTANIPAISAYSRFGLMVVGEARDICGHGKTCYQMVRTFPRV